MAPKKEELLKRARGAVAEHVRYLDEQHQKVMRAFSNGAACDSVLYNEILQVTQQSVRLAAQVAVVEDLACPKN